MLSGVMISLNTLLARLLIPITAVATAIFSETRGWGVLHLVDWPGMLKQPCGAAPGRYPVITLLAANATIVGVLVEVPVMLGLVKIANRTPHWFSAEPAGTPKSTEPASVN